MKAERRCCKLPLNTTEEDEKEMEEATANMGAAEEMSVDDTAAAFF